MSLHAYSRIWLHLVWATLERRPVISKAAAPKLSEHLRQYASRKGIYMKINYVNAYHVHALMDLPTDLAVEDLAHLLKGESSHWLNEANLLGCKFSWGRGYGAFSVSHSRVAEVARYIAQQEQHHRKRGFADELRTLVERYGLKWREDETVETVESPPDASTPR